MPAGIAYVTYPTRDGWLTAEVPLSHNTVRAITKKTHALVATGPSSVESFCNLIEKKGTHTK